MKLADTFNIKQSECIQKECTVSFHPSCIDIFRSSLSRCENKLPNPLVEYMYFLVALKLFFTPNRLSPVFHHSDYRNPSSPTLLCTQT